MQHWRAGDSESSTGVFGGSQAHERCGVRSTWLMVGLLMDINPDCDGLGGQGLFQASMGRGAVDRASGATHFGALHSRGRASMIWYRPLRSEISLRLRSALCWRTCRKDAAEGCVNHDLMACSDHNGGLSSRLINTRERAEEVARRACLHRLELPCAPIRRGR